MKNGKVSQAILDRSVLRPLRMAGAAGPEEIFGADCAFLNAVEEKTLITTSQDVVSGLYDRTPAMIVAGCLNNLACAGAKAKNAVLDLMYPADADEKGMAAIIRETAQALTENGVTAVNGHTAASNAVMRPVLTVTMTGVIEADKTDIKVNAGDAIVMAGCAGIGGTALLADAGREDLLKRFPLSLVNDAAAFKNNLLIGEYAAAAGNFGGAVMKDISEGGAFGALWELAEREQIGFSVNLRSILLRQETVEICEFFDLNPYQLYGAGGLIMISPRGEEICSAINGAGGKAAVIGYVTENKGREIINGEETRYLEKPQQDMLRVIADRG